MDSLWRDLRFGARTLLHSPAVTALALLTLTLGIGANTAIFSVVSGVLLEPLAFPHPDELVVVIASAPKLGFPRFSASPPHFKDWREQNRVSSSLDAMNGGRFTLTAKGAQPQAVAGAEVTGDFFRTLGVRPLLGRLLAPADDRPGGERVAVLSYRLWHRRFGGDPGIVNRQITIDGRAHTVVGVAPRGLDFPRQSELWVPLALDFSKSSRGAHYLMVVGRLKPGASLERAQADLSPIARRLELQYPDQNTDWGVVLMRLRDVMVRDIRPALTMLQRAVWVVLLIACANVANLLLARMGSRERELAVRTALGAGRLRLMRQLIVESVILFAAGGALGLLVALWGTRTLVALNPDAIPRAEGIGIDARVLVYTLLISVATGAVFGLVPALSAIGRPLSGSLKGGGRAMAGGRRGNLVRDVLVIGEVALALMLLVGAGLLIQSFARLQSVDPGFKPRGVITAQVSLPAVKYPDDPRQAAFFQRALERIRSLPGVQHAASIYPLPLSSARFFQLSFVVAARPVPKPGEEQSAHVRFISPDYFRTMEIPALKGRAFTEQDGIDDQRVAVVNREMASRIWPGADPLGQRLTFGDPTKPTAKWMTVVGVVGDVRGSNLGNEPEMELYCSQYQTPSSAAALVVRTASDPLSLVAPVRRALQEIDGDLPLDKVQTMEQVVSSSLAQNRVKTVLLGIFAALALVLAAVGIYGLVSFSVAQRVHEMGIRTARGARRAEVLAMIVRQGMKLVAIGLVAGLGGAFASSRLLADQVYRVSVVDPLTYIGVPIVLTAVALLANWLPARRATRVDPQEALRSE